MCRPCSPRQHCCHCGQACRKSVRRPGQPAGAGWSRSHRTRCGRRPARPTGLPVQLPYRSGSRCPTPGTPPRCPQRSQGSSPAGSPSSCPKPRCTPPAYSLQNRACPARSASETAGRPAGVPAPSCPCPSPRRYSPKHHRAQSSRSGFPPPRQHPAGPHCRQPYRTPPCPERSGSLFRCPPSSCGCLPRHFSR